MTDMRIKPYDITNGEKVTYGYYSALEAVFQQFISKLESYFYDEYKLVFDFSYKIRTGHKFQQYLNGLKQPSSIFILGLSPLMRDSLLKADNRYINLILSKPFLYKEGKIAIDNGYSLSESNSRQVKEHIEQILSLFENSWSKIQEVNCDLKKVVSNRIKAKVMDPTESCVEVTVNMKQKRFKTNLEFCFSTYQLDRIIEKRGSRGLLATSGAQPYDHGIRDHLTDLLLNESSFEIKGVLGTINLSSRDLIDSYKNQEIIPITSHINTSAVVELDNIPVLAAEIGETSGLISLKIEDTYSSKETENQKAKKSFSQIRFSRR
jgi:flagellar motor switch protein FliM